MEGELRADAGYIGASLVGYYLEKEDLLAIHTEARLKFLYAIQFTCKLFVVLLMETYDFS